MSVVRTCIRRHLASNGYAVARCLLRSRQPIGGSFVAFDYTADALSEIQAFFTRSGKTIVAPTVKDILEEQIALKLA